MSAKELAIKLAKDRRSRELESKVNKQLAMDKLKEEHKNTLNFIDSVLDEFLDNFQISRRTNIIAQRFEWHLSHKKDDTTIGVYLEAYKTHKSFSDPKHSILIPDTKWKLSVHNFGWTSALIFSLQEEDIKSTFIERFAEVMERYY